jgi:hypothetical protein
VRNGQQRLPDLDLERHASKRERHLENLALSAEIFGQLPFGRDEQAVSRLFR